jgi:hypothetical protein
MNKAVSWIKEGFILLLFPCFAFCYYFVCIGCQWKGLMDRKPFGILLYEQLNPTPSTRAEMMLLKLLKRSRTVRCYLVEQKLDGGTYE